ncbi:MAG TPA: flavodoxin family protein [Methanomassiliicoccales archaeon]|jgi:multimeric flavodoxin WrbA
MVTVVGILGSPHAKGNTATLLESFLAGARDAGAETVRFDAAEMAISGCRACNDCQDTGVCVVDDDMERIYEAICRADVLVLATPLYFSGMSSHLKAVIDRCQCLWQNARRGKAVQDKSAYLLSVGAMENANFRNVLSEVRSFCIGVGITFRGEVTVPGVEAEGDILTHGDDLDRAYLMGREAVSAALI